MKRKHMALLSAVMLFVFGMALYAKAKSPGPLDENKFYTSHNAHENLGTIDLKSAAGTDIGPYKHPELDITRTGWITGNGAIYKNYLYTILNRRIPLDEDPPHVEARLARVNPDTGEVELLGSPIYLNLLGLEISHRGEVYATGFSLTNDLGHLYGDKNLYRIELRDATVTLVGYTGIERIMDLAFDPEGNLWATVGNVLYTLDMETGAPTTVSTITGVDEDHEIMGIGFTSDGELFATTPFSDGLYSIEPVSGVATKIGQHGLVIPHGGDIPMTPYDTEDYSQTFFLKLESGLNMISLPLKPLTQRTARDLMNEIGATMAIKLDATKGRFVGFTEADAGDGFQIEGGQGYIVNVKESKVVPFVGTAWTNEPPLAAPTLEADSVWAFVVSGALFSSDDKSNFDGYTIQVRNLRTGVMQTSEVMSLRGAPVTKQSQTSEVLGHFALASADLLRNSIIQAGDKLEIIAKDASGNVVSKVVRTIDADNIGKAYLNVSLRLGDIIPSQTILLQNYPNPFNPETWIPFALAEDSLVTINIYGAKGNLVRRFDIGKQEAGIYTSRDRALYWDGRNNMGERVSSGIYFYQLRAGNFTAVRRLVIMK